jgi:hypothetical protein
MSHEYTIRAATQDDAREPMESLKLNGMKRPVKAIATPSILVNVLIETLREITLLTTPQCLK